MKPSPAVAVPSVRLQRLTVLLLTTTSGVAQAQSMGGGLFGYAQNIILFLGAAAIITALVGAVFKPEIVKSAVWAAVVLVVIFFIIRNVGSLQSAVSGG